MKLHPVLDINDGVISVRLFPQFVGDLTDSTDRMLLSTYGDPLVNMGGTIVEDLGAGATGVTFKMPDVWVSLTTQMNEKIVTFSTSASSSLNGPLNVVVTSPTTPVKAAMVYTTVLQNRCKDAILLLRTKSSTPPSVSDLIV